MKALQAMLSCACVVVASSTGAMAMGTGVMASDKFASALDGIELAQTQTKQNCDNRQDSRQDCRNAEGAVGADKRNCKQDTRQDGSQDDDSGGG